MRQFFSDDFTFTKRHLGAIMLLAGVVVVLAMFGAEVISSRSTGIGAMQKLGIAVGAASAIIGLTLLPLGNRPA
jgi:Na+/H+ antiporter NhaA